MHSFSLLAVLVAVAAVIPVSVVHGGDASRPHSHPGDRNKPFKAGAPDVTLTVVEQQKLATGVTIQRQIVDKAAGTATALAVQDVAAPVSVVLERIVDFPNYPNMVSGVSECGNYREVSHSNGTKTLMTRMVLNAAWLKFEGFFHHTYYPSLQSVTWTLDYTRFSDFVDSVGYWYVAKHPDHPETASRVFYSINVIPGEWVPQMVVDILQKKALTDATAWVKVESEKRAPPPPLPPKPSTTMAAASSKRSGPKSLQCKLWSVMPATASQPRPSSCSAAAVAAAAAAAAAAAEAASGSWYSYLFG